MRGSAPLARIPSVWDVASHFSNSSFQSQSRFPIRPSLHLRRASSDLLFPMARGFVLPGARKAEITPGTREKATVESPSPCGTVFRAGLDTGHNIRAGRSRGERNARRTGDVATGPFLVAGEPDFKWR
ncbi:hypothetical protein N7492_006154 [Penicillium capsulatum]|uniref:Uncharacterized protein n=1 Tax=Penicillium capsulatum TaxID=69766 RepID=A0A9W9I323_9EURO|nr:hypothetical protein N7492_006154 [Penicillium capsulatum]KAJ6108805.1 hypothetical protein N7512_008642 [Penicillium capsulatum]